MAGRKSKLLTQADILERAQLQYEQEKAECVRDALEGWKDRPVLNPTTYTIPSDDTENPSS